MKRTHSVRQVGAAILATPQPRFYGREILDQLDIKPGVLYPILHRFTAAGWLAEDGTEHHGGRARRYYRLTDAGREALADMATPADVPQPARYADVLRAVLAELAKLRPDGGPDLQWRPDHTFHTTMRDLHRAVAAGIDAVREEACRPHVYLSTGCLHGDHAYCQAMVGQAGTKRPGTCKFCESPCVCPCHTDPGFFDG